MADTTEITPKEVDQDPGTEPETEETKQLERGPGRSRDDDLPMTARRLKPNPLDPCSDVPYAKYAQFKSDEPNLRKRTIKLWAWLGELPPRIREKIDVYVYREWPPLIPPPIPEGDDEKEYKNIDKFSATESIESDEALGDKYGAGDYKIFVNTGLKPFRRTLATAWVKGTRDFRANPPCDKRITEMGEDGFPKWIDKNDPQCRQYIEFLRSRGIIPEIYQAEREKLKMEVQAKETESMSAVERMANKMVDAVKEQAKTAAPATPALGHDTVKQVMDTAMEGAKISTEMLKDTIKTLREGKGGGEDANSALTIALAIAEKISKASDPKPYLDIIAKLNESVMELKMEMLNQKIDAISKQANPAPAAPPPANNTPMGGLKSMIEDFRAIQELVGGGGAEEVAEKALPGWAGLIERGLPHISSLGQSLLGMYLASQNRTMPPMPQQPPATVQQQPMPQPPAPTPAPGCSDAALTSPCPNPQPHPLQRCRRSRCQRPPLKHPQHHPSPLLQLCA